MRCAIFVDAGYLFAQGSAAIAGEKVARSKLTVNKAVVLDALVRVKNDRCPATQLLRIYWYDGAATTGPTSQHFDFAFTEDVKLRLGFLNSNGQQKGVDSLIVTDMIELARNRAITDAVLLSGDEDIRVGVSIAQSYGLRVHLLGIAPSRGSQSQLLLQEADTTTEWTKEQVGAFLQITTPPLEEPKVRTSPENKSVETSALQSIFEELVDELVGDLTDDQRSAIETLATIPKDIDGKLLSSARQNLGRLLNELEKRQIRSVLRQKLKKSDA
jgi:uncharacterized LabA/DUF88 family protein